METVYDIIMTLFAFIFGVIMVIEGLLRHAMQYAGFPAQAQTIILLVAAVFMAIAAFRAIGGVVAGLIIIFLVLFMLQALAPQLTAHFQPHKTATSY